MVGKKNFFFEHTLDKLGHIDCTYDNRELSDTLHCRNSVILWQHKQDISPALRKEISD